MTNRSPGPPLLSTIQTIRRYHPHRVTVNKSIRYKLTVNKNIRYCQLLTRQYKERIRMQNGPKPCVETEGSSGSVPLPAAMARVFLGDPSVSTHVLDVGGFGSSVSEASRIIETVPDSNRTPQRDRVVTSQCARPRATPTRARPHSPLPASSRPRSLTLGTLLPLPPPSRHPSRRGKERDPYAPRPPATHASNAVTSLRCAGVLPRRGRRRRRRTPYPPRGGAFVVILM